MRPSAFDDRSVTMDGPEQLALLASTLGSRTRLAILQALVASPEPLHINEAARRVGVDASPARTHLETLVKAGLASEVTSGTGRERRFETRLKNVRLVLEGVNRVAAPEKRTGPPPKDVARLEKKLAALDRDMMTLQQKAARLKQDLEAAWAKAAAAPAPTKAKP